MRQVIRFSAYVAAGCLAGALLGLLLLPRPSPVARGGNTGTFSPALGTRLQQAGAKSGEVQVALIWHDGSRLHLSCVDPTGQALDEKTPRVASGGEFDLAGKGAPPEGVANLYWPTQAAPAGRYQVFVARERGSGEAEPTTFTCGVKAGARVEEFSGGIRAAGASSLVYEFAYRGGWPLPLWNGIWTTLVTAGAALGLFLGQVGQPIRPAFSARSLAFGATILLAAALLAGVGSYARYAEVGAYDWAPPVVWGGSWALLGGLLSRLTGPGLAAWRVALCGALSGALGFLVFEAADNLVADPACKLWCASAQGACLGAAFALVHPALARRSRSRRSPGVASGFSLRLTTGQVVPLTDRLRLTGSDLPGVKPRFLRRAVAQVRQKPGSPGIFGLTNLSRHGWLAELPGGLKAKVLPGQALRLVGSARIDFGMTRGDVL